MIDPSSSHTAGAARIAYLAQKMINGTLAKVEFIRFTSLLFDTNDLNFLRYVKNTSLNSTSCNCKIGRASCRERVFPLV